MPFHKTALPGVLIFDPIVWDDSRGYFYEAYNEQTFHGEGIQSRFMQDNQSSSSKGVIRGLHYQLNPFAQTKLVRVLSGEILDVAVDIRRGSPTFGQSFCIMLSGENKKQLLIPAGFAHGFSVISAQAVILYKCDQLYNKESEAGIRYDDPALGIDWQVAPGEQIISPKDHVLPFLKDCKNNFDFAG